MGDLSKETLRKLIAEYKGEDLAGYLVEVFAKAREIQSGASSLHREAAAEEQRHLQEQNKLIARWQELRQQCSHWETRIAGLGAVKDSYTECVLCGEVV